MIGTIHSSGDGKRTEPPSRLELGERLAHHNKVGTTSQRLSLCEDIDNIRTATDSTNG